MTPDEVDRMLEAIGVMTWDPAKKSGTSTFHTAAIPQPKGDAFRAPIKPEGKPPLKRQMSELALNKRLPPPVADKRTFFRTWVRAVRR
jgi:hypothetical protein